MKFLLLILSLSYLNAYSIKYKTNANSDGEYMYAISCSDGSQKSIFVYPKNTGHKYFDGDGHSFYVLNEAANYVCKKINPKKVIVVKSSALYCKNKSTMQRVLKSDIEYMIAKLDGESGNKDCGNAAEDSKVIVINIYNGKSKGLIDDYVKVKAGNGYFYVKKSELK